MDIHILNAFSSTGARSMDMLAGVGHVGSVLLSTHGAVGGTMLPSSAVVGFKGGPAVCCHPRPPLLDVLGEDLHIRPETCYKKIFIWRELQGPDFSNCQQ